MKNKVFVPFLVLVTALAPAFVGARPLPSAGARAMALGDAYVA